MHFPLKTLLLASSVISIVTGCVPVVVGTGMMAGGYTTLRDKKVGESLTDSKMDAEIKKRLYKISPDLYSSVSVVVDQGCVLLTGTVTNPEWISLAEKESWAVEGVIVVDNNLTSGDPIPVSQIMKDGFITSACRSSIICSKDIKSVNYKIKTMNGIVYVTGLARSESELDTALSKIQGVNGVNKVISYVNIMEKGAKND